MTETLQERLRSKETRRDAIWGVTVEVLNNPDGPEAADRIDALERALADAFYEGFNMAASMTPHTHELLHRTGDAWARSKARAALTPSERKDSR